MSQPRGTVVFSDVVGRLRVATFAGAIGDEELTAAYERLLATPGYVADSDDLVDLRQVTRLEVSSSALRQLIGLFHPIDSLGFRTRTAIVAPSDLTFGMSRMYELLRGDHVPEEVRVFRDFDEARDWLLSPRS